MSDFMQQIENRWRDHVSDEEAKWVDSVRADPNALPVEEMLATLIQRLGREVSDAIEAAWEERMGEDL